MIRIKAGQYIILAKQLQKTDTVLGMERLKATDTPRIYWEINCFQNPSKSIWKKLLEQNSMDLTPSFFFVNESAKVFIGCEEGLFAIDIPSGKVIFQQELFAPFFRFHQIEGRISNGAIVLALCELELFAFDIFGNLKWKASFPEVLNELQQVNNSLKITDLSEITYEIDIDTGKFK